MTNTNEAVGSMIDNMISWAKSRMGNANYAGWCLSFIEDALEKSNNIEIFGGDSAKESCEMYKDALCTGMPERGAFVFYDCLCPSGDGPVNWGHCGIALENGQVIHAWDKVRIDDYRAVEKLTAITGDHPKYIGWVPLVRVLAEKRACRINDDRSRRTGADMGQMEFESEYAVAQLFTPEPVKEIRTVNTSHGKDDYREAIFILTESGKRFVIKAAANSFTTVESIIMWRRCAQEYLNHGCYCPQILASLDGSFPSIRYKGTDCLVYAEEFSKYETAPHCKNVKPFRNELYLMTAKIALEKYDYAVTPSAYSLFEPFPGDKTDEVTENAMSFRDYCETLPGRFHEQSHRMYDRWTKNREALRKVYFKLPCSVYQADFNDTNVLVDHDGCFVGLCDFNLAGKDEFLNYLFREIYTGSFDEELAEILRALKLVSGIYPFSEEEIQAAPLIYRCVKPLWYSRIEALKAMENDYDRVQACLDEMENAQLRTIDFKSCMQS